MLKEIKCKSVEICHTFTELFRAIPDVTAATFQCLLARDLLLYFKAFRYCAAGTVKIVLNAENK